MIELFTLVFSLALGILKAGLSTPPCPFLDCQLGSKLLILLLGSAQSLIGLGAKVGLNLNFIPSILDSFFSHEDLLDSLHIGNKGVR